MCFLSHYIALNQVYCNFICLQKVNLTKLGTPTLWRYWKHFNLVSSLAAPFALNQLALF